MIIEEVIGELLYIGIVAEKGRCYGVKWKKGYKKIIKIHIESIYQLLSKYKEKDVSRIRIEIDKFKDLCKKNNEIGKFYQFADVNISKLYFGVCYDDINNIMIEIFNDLLIELNRIFVSKRNVYHLLNALHNLPRVYLVKDKNTLCCVNQAPITREDALKYTFEIMNNDMRKKYFK